MLAASAADLQIGRRLVEDWLKIGRRLVEDWSKIGEDWLKTAYKMATTVAFCVYVARRT
jgi:hypothetical protein